MTPFVAELIGTALLLLLGVGVVANVVLTGTKGHASGWIVITAGWGMAVFVAVACVGPYSGAHINPAVTICLAIVGKFAWADVPSYILAQMIGAFVGAALAFLAYYKHYATHDDPAGKLATFSTGPAIRSPGWNLVTEAQGTFVLLIAVLHFAHPDAQLANGETIKVGLGSVGAVPVGLLVFAIGLCLGGPTGYAINPARDLGPRIAHALLPIPGKGSSDWSYAWVPIVGPILGALAAAGVHVLAAG
jgi:glycerol uptake facilitator protein